MLRYALFILFAAVVLPGFSQKNAPALPPVDEDVPFFAEDTLNLDSLQRARDSLLILQNRRAIPPSVFAGRLYVRTDNDASLPVYINGKRMGTTPLRIAHLLVGRYKISYMDSTLRDSLLEHLGGPRTAIPQDYAPLFQGRQVKIPGALKCLAEYAEQIVIVQDNMEYEVIFPVKEMLAAMEESKSRRYGRLALGGAIAVGVIVLVILSAN
jgi:hypothetical protein